VAVTLRRLALVILLSSFSVGIAVGQTSEFDSRLAIRRGNEKYAKTEFEAAIREYRRVTEDAGDAYAQSLYNIGVCYYELWRTEEAVIFYKRAIAAREGRYPRAWHALGVALEDQGKLPKAKEAYRQSITTSHGEFGAAHFKLGLLIASEGDYETAATLFRKAIARAGDHVAASHNNLGVMLARLGRMSEAQPEFEFALKETDGAFEDAAYNLRLCRSLLTVPTKALVASLTVFKTADVMLK
jgi:tetratricopeptide (TPR) repeat protein